LTLEKPLDNIKEEDLKELIENHVIEKKDLDYKLSLPSSRDGDKKEFLADIVSFANTSGGDIIYGIAQDNSTGYPNELSGIDLPNKDQEILRLESIIRDGIEPRMPPVAIQPVSLTNSKTILIIRVQKSWLSPHRVKFAGDRRFYARGTNGKYELDVGELRAAFMFRDSINDKIRKFRENRIASLFANETPVPFYNNAKIVLHLIPLISFNPSTFYDIDRVNRKFDYIRPINGTSLDFRYNLEGFLISSVSGSGLSYSYTQIYRNGVIEAADALELSGTEKIIPSVSYERDIIRALSNYLSALKYLNVQLPIAIFLTLMAVKGYSMATSKFFEEESRTIDRDILQLPEALVDTYDIKPEVVLRPTFDAVWNSCGLAKSLNYDEKGEWKPKRRDHFR
jgi:hypothetical protein